MLENFDSRLKQANLRSKNDVTDIGKKTDFDDQLKNINIKVTSNKRRHIEVNKKLDNLAKKVKQISTEN